MAPLMQGCFPNRSFEISNARILMTIPDSHTHYSKRPADGYANCFCTGTRCTDGPKARVRLKAFFESIWV